MCAHTSRFVAGIFVAATWFLCFVGEMTAHGQVAFMPGDAFFHTTLTNGDALQLPEGGGDVVLSYSRMPLSGGFGGYAGFERLEITNVPPTMIAALRTVYADLRRKYPDTVRSQPDADGNRIALKTGGFHLFVYNRDVKWRFEWNDQKLAVKYNEHWTNLPKQAITPTQERRLGFGGVPAIAYQSFVPVYPAVVEDWRNGPRFDELKVAVPNGIPWGLTGPEIVNPVSVAADAIQWVLCPDDDMTRYFSGNPGLEFFTFSVDGVMRYTWTKNGLVVEDHVVHHRQNGSSVGRGERSEARQSIETGVQMPE